MDSKVNYIKFFQPSRKDGAVNLGFARRFDGKNQSGELKFKFNRPIPLDYNWLAVTLSTLCRRKYHEVNFDFDIESRFFLCLQKYIDGDFRVRKVLNDNRQEKPGRERITLNFSGGLDSLAAYLLLPREIDLVSIDFPRLRGKEWSSFKNFDPLVLVTNARSLGLAFDDIDWQFMGMGGFLSNFYFKNAYYSYGGILECNPGGLTPYPSFVSKTIFEELLITQVLLVRALTEIATMKIVSRLMPNYCEASLRSIAPQGSVKFLRKLLILYSLYEKYSSPQLSLSLSLSLWLNQKVGFWLFFSRRFFIILSI